MSAPGVLVWLGTGGGFPAWFLTLLFLFRLFPDGRLVSRRWQPVAWLASAVVIVVALGPQLLSLLESDGSRMVLPVLRVIVQGAFTAWPLALPASVTSLFLRYQRAGGDVRLQIRWFAFSAFFVATAFAIGMVSETVGRPAAGTWDIAVYGSTLLPVATGIAILRHRLYDIDVIINRTLVYGMVTALLAGLFAALSIVSQRLALAITGQESQAAVVLAALVVTALFQPVRTRVQTVVDHRFYRSKYDATRTLEEFASQIRDEVELDQLVAGLVAVVRETMQPTHASLWLRHSESGKPTPDRRP